MRRIFRGILAGCVVLSLLVIVAIPIGAKQITLKFLWPAFTEQKIRYGKHLVSAFEKAHPNIKVDMILDVNPGQKLTVLTAGGAPPDVGWLGAEWVTFADQGFLMPLDGFIERDKEEVAPGDFIPNVWNTYNWKGKRHLMPSGFTVSIFYYNRDLFEAFGLLCPKMNWTWEQMVEASQKLTRDTDGDGKMNKWGICVWHGSEWSILSYNGSFFSDNGRIANFDTPAFAWALKAFRDLIHTYRVHPTPTDVNWEYQSKWLRGDFGLYLGGAWLLEPTRKEADFAWDFVPMPIATIGGKEYRGTFYGPEGFYIHTKTKHPGEAWEFVKFITGKEITEWAAREGHIVPGRNSAGATFVQSGAPKNMQAFLVSATFGVPWGAHPVWVSEILPAIQPNIYSQIGIGAEPKISPEQAAKEIQKLVQGILDRWAKKPTK